MNKVLFFAICLLSTISFTYSKADQINIPKANTLVFTVLDGAVYNNRIKITDKDKRTLGFIGATAAFSQPTTVIRPVKRGANCFLEEDDRTVDKLNTLAANLNSLALELGAKAVILNFDACNKYGPENLLEVR